MLNKTISLCDSAHVSFYLPIQRWQEIIGKIVGRSVKTDHISSLVVWIRENEKYDVLLIYSRDVDFQIDYQTYLDMVSRINRASSKDYKREDKQVLIKNLSKHFCDVENLSVLDRIKYRILSITTHKYNTDKELVLDESLKQDVEALLDKEKTSLFKFCAEYGRSDIKLFSSFMKGKFVIRDSFHLASEFGHVAVLKWLHATFNLTVEDAVSAGALIWAASRGHIEVLMFLHETFGLIADDARADNNYALRCAAENEYSDVVDWLKETFGLTL